MSDYDTLRVRVERAQEMDGSVPSHVVDALLDAIDDLTAERDAAAAKERAAVVAWLRLFSPRDSWDGYVPTEVAAAIEAGDHLEATRA